MVLFQMMEFLKSLAGTEFVGFSNATWVLRFKECNLIVLHHTKCNSLNTSYVLAVSSPRGRPVIGIMQLVIISKRKKWVMVYLMFKYNDFKCLFHAQVFRKNKCPDYMLTLILIPAVLSRECRYDSSSWLLLSGKTLWQGFTYQD